MRAHASRHRVCGVVLAASCCAAVPTSSAVAQGATTSATTSAVTTGDPVRDSAAVAREAWRAAARAGSVAEALALVERAATAWPLQPAYWAGLARVAAQASDTVRFRRAAATLDAMNLAPALLGDPRLATAATALLEAAPLAALRAHAAPIATGGVLATVDDPHFFAEGLDAHTASGTVYVASIRQRTVVAWHAGRVRDLQLARDARIGAVFGVRVAADGRTLWCTTAPHVNMQRDSTRAVATRADSMRPVAALVQVRVDDGRILDIVPLPRGTQDRLPGDLAIAADGSVLVTDSDDAALLHWHPATRRWDVVTDARFRSLQGIALVPDGRTAIVADYSHGLFRVDLATHAVHRIADRPATTVLGLDGLTWSGNGIIAVQNGVEPARIVHIGFDRALQQVAHVDVLARDATTLPEPTIGARFGDAYVFVANSQWSAYDAQGQPRAGTAFSPTRVWCIPLPPTATGSTTTTRNGSRNTASVPPSARSCSASKLASP